MVSCSRARWLASTCQAPPGEFSELSPSNARKKLREETEQQAPTFALSRSISAPVPAAPPPPLGARARAGTAGLARSAAHAAGLLLPAAATVAGGLPLSAAAHVAGLPAANVAVGDVVAGAGSRGDTGLRLESDTADVNRSAGAAPALPARPLPAPVPALAVAAILLVSSCRSAALSGRCGV